MNVNFNGKVWKYDSNIEDVNFGRIQYEVEAPYFTVSIPNILTEPKTFSSLNEALGFITEFEFNLIEDSKKYMSENAN